MSEQEKWFHFRVSKDLDIWLSRNPDAYRPCKLRLGKPLISLDPEELDWLITAMTFVQRTRRKKRGYRYNWLVKVPETWRIPQQLRFKLGRLELAYNSGQDLLDLSLDS